jgi:hypothetical protein
MSACPEAERIGRRRVLAAVALAPALFVGFVLAGGPVRGSGAEAAAARVEPGRAFAFLTELQTQHPGRWRRQRAWLEAPAFVGSALVAAGATDLRLEQAPYGKDQLTNVRAVVPGVDRTTRVILAAHHDTVNGAPGAIDDGGAVACLVEAARVLAAGPPPACDVELAVYDLEEQGLIGSKGHIRRLPPGEKERVKAVLALELVGWRKDSLVLHTIPKAFATRAKGVPPAWLPAAVRAAGADAGASVGLGDPLVGPWYQATVRAIGVKTGSDADAWLEAGVPACLLTGSSLTNFYAAYHQPADDLPMVDPARLDDAARVAVAAAVELAALPAEVARAREQGDVYLLVGARTVGRAGLTVVGLAAALPLVLLAAGLRRARPSLASAVGSFAVGLAGLAVLPSLVGLVTCGPLALGVALAACLPPARRRLVLYAAASPALAEVILVAAAAAMFGGFDWIAGSLETALLVLTLGLGLGCASAQVRP